VRGSRGEERARGSVLLGGEDKGWVCGLVGMRWRRERGRKRKRMRNGCGKRWVRGERLRKAHLGVWLRGHGERSSRCRKGGEETQLSRKGWDCSRAPCSLLVFEIFGRAVSLVKLWLG